MSGAELSATLQGARKGYRVCVKDATTERPDLTVKCWLLSTARKRAASYTHEGLTAYIEPIIHLPREARVPCARTRNA